MGVSFGAPWAPAAKLLGTWKTQVSEGSEPHKRKFVCPRRSPSPAKKPRVLQDSDLHLSAKTSKAAEELGIAESGVPYTSLIRKLLETEWLIGKVKDSDALVALQENGGNLNRTRHALKTSLHLA